MIYKIQTMEDFDITSIVINPIYKLLPIRGETLQMNTDDFELLMRHPLLCHITGNLASSQIALREVTWIEEVYMVKEGEKSFFKMTLLGVHLIVVKGDN